MSRYNGEPGEQGSATGQREGHFHTNLSADRVIGEDVQRFAKALLWWLSFNPKRLGQFKRVDCEFGHPSTKVS